MYELSVLLSLLCDNKAQLASSITRLVKDVYVNAINSPEPKTFPVAQDLIKIFHNELVPVQPWSWQNDEHESKNRRHALFLGIWMMESLCSNRLGNIQEFLTREIEARKLIPDSMTTNPFFDFAHNAFLAVRRNDVLVLQKLLSNNCTELFTHSARGLSDVSDVFWLQVMTLQLVPRVRAQSEFILRRSFLRIAVRPEFALLLKGHTHLLNEQEIPANETSIQWVESLLLLSPDPNKAIITHFTLPQEQHHPKVRIRQSLNLLVCLSRQFGFHDWDSALSFLRPRLVEASNTYALALRP